MAISAESKKVIEKIRRGEIDINNQSLFFATLIKGLLLNLNKEITIRGGKVRHFILHTGDDTMYILNKGQDASIEPLEISNEDAIYNQIPRCLVEPGAVDVVPDQLTSPYSRGQLVYEEGDNIYTMEGEFRRMPVKMSFDLKYHVDSFRDQLELIQQIITKMSFVRTFRITYMGQTICCSYKVPDAFDDEHLTELEGTTTESKIRSMSASIEVESNLPIWNPDSVISSETFINMYPDKAGNLKTVGHIKIKNGEEITVKEHMLK